MTDNLIRDLARLQSYATNLRGLLTEAQAEAPRSSEGTDRSGAVQAVLGPDGLPRAFRVAPGWHRRLAAEDFGAAVLEAFHAAMGERLADWTSTLTEGGWQARVDQLRDLSDPPSTSPTAASTSGDIPLAFRHPADEVPARPVDHVAEDVIKAFDHVEDFCRPAPQAIMATGSSHSGTLTLTLSQAGLVSCTADPSWVSAQSGATLMNALGEALTIARASLESRTDQSASTGSLDRLFVEALTLLRDPRSIVS